jgi:hypothetical protein
MSGHRPDPAGRVEPNFELFHGGGFVETNGQRWAAQFFNGAERNGGNRADNAWKFPNFRQKTSKECRLRIEKNDSCLTFFKLLSLPPARKSSRVEIRLQGATPHLWDSAPYNDGQKTKAGGAARLDFPLFRMQRESPESPAQASQSNRAALLFFQLPA